MVGHQYLSFGRVKFEVPSRHPRRGIEQELNTTEPRVQKSPNERDVLGAVGFLVCTECLETR